MTTTKRWTVEILIDEDDDGTTHAVARLDTSEDAHVHGQGASTAIGEADESVRGDDLAVAKALSAVAAKLMVKAGTGIPSQLRLTANG